MYDSQFPMSLTARRQRKLRINLNLILACNIYICIAYMYARILYLPT